MQEKISPTVLVADDNELILKLIEHKLEQEGMDVTCVSDGDQALAAIEMRRPDLVVLDGMMPGKDGFIVLQKIKGSEDLKDIPVVLLTARGRQEDVVSGLNLGADEYIVKPFMPEELVVRITRLLNRTQGP